MDIKKLKSKIMDNKWEAMIFCAIVVLILIAIYNKLTGKIGSWSTSIQPELDIIRTQKLWSGKTRENTQFMNIDQLDSGANSNLYFNNDQSTKNHKESQGERECRRVMESIYGKPFIKVRPSFLRNNAINGSNLELDCYNDQLKIAVEYNGEQHYNYVRFFHRNRDAFHNQKYRDDMKRRLCQENGILLIEVPYTVKIPEIKQYIVKMLIKNGKLS